MSETLLSAAFSRGGVSGEQLSLATATPADVLFGKTFYSGNVSLKTGTLANIRTRYIVVTHGGNGNDMVLVANIIKIDGDSVQAERAQINNSSLTQTLFGKFHLTFSGASDISLKSDIDLTQRLYFTWRTNSLGSLSSNPVFIKSGNIQYIFASTTRAVTVNVYDEGDTTKIY